MRKATCEHVHKIANEMGYDPARSHTARRLASKKTGLDVPNQVIAVILPQEFFLFTYFNSLFRGICDYLRDEDYAVLVCYSHVNVADLEVIQAD